MSTHADMRARAHAGGKSVYTALGAVYKSVRTGSLASARERAPTRLSTELARLLERAVEQRASFGRSPRSAHGAKMAL
eukprot:6214321-Pleurochrysis_carterae.AAC.7